MWVKIAVKEGKNEPILYNQCRANWWTGNAGGHLYEDTIFPV